VQIKQIIQDFHDSCAVVELSSDTLLSASDLRTKYRFSFWDGLIIASALFANVSVFYSEDMQDNLIVEQQLTILNPFK
jgi:predicted nucleic acid-binding protein